MVKERWIALCEQAATEEDPVRFMELIHEINRLLEQKEQRLEQRSQSHGAR
jgi:hypothetical protein